MTSRIFRTLHVLLVVLVAITLGYKLVLDHEPSLSNTLDIFLICISAMLIAVNVVDLHRSIRERRAIAKSLDACEAKTNSFLRDQINANEESP